ncbi:DUF2334 domain-containing protein [Sphingomonas sp. ASV193]|uniref:DUF2334 domain-containing protein n=1 Tax=Sphingomonas sp. ASV193 TaxID=3144405 RepID=UPI0032E8BC5E
MSNERLLFSIHDVAPAFEDEVDRLHALAQPIVGDRLAMLVVPNHWKSEKITAGTPFAARLRGWAEAGIEMFLHGFTHRDDSDHGDAAARLKATKMTAGEGEFLGLSHAEAARRIADGRARVEDIIGRPVAGFIAPAWLYGEGALAAIREAGFPLAEDHLKVWRPADGKVLHRAPVITWASRTPARLRSSLWVANAARALPMPRTMRVATHPPDIRVPALVDSIGATLKVLAKKRRPAAYAELLG